MTILTKKFNPGGAGGIIPGTPGSPGTPAYCIDVATTSPSYTYIALTDPKTGQLVLIPVSGPNVTTITHECFPATAPTPAGAPTLIPSVAANYYTGWNAAADSIATLAADGMFQVSADASAVGIVVGLTPTPVEPGYSGITHGIYFASGTYQYFENGVPLTPATAFISTDVFTIRRLGTQVAYYKGSTLDYTSLQASVGAVYANASMYFGGDRILSAAFTFPISALYAGIGGRGTFDPALPSSPPPVTYGVPPQYVSVAGQFGDLRDYITDSNLTIVSPGPTPGSPGSGPPDSNGDWSGRSGGTLRELVGVATAYDNGTVTAGPPPPSTGADPITGDWSGRSGSSLRTLAGQIYGSSGNGTAYSIASGRLTGLSGNAGAALLAPNYVVDSGYLGGMGGFAIALNGMNGVVQGTLPDLEGFITNSTGAYTNPEGPPPPSTGPDPVTGDWPGRAGGQLRQLVGQIYSFPAPAELFEDNYTGTGTLAVHNPDIGGPYGIVGGGSPSGYVLNGTGGLPSALTTAGELVSVIAPAGQTYTLTGAFTVPAAGTDTLTLVLGVATTTTGNTLIGAVLTYDGVNTWTLTTTISNANGTVLYTSSKLVSITGAGTHTIAIVETPGGTTVTIDGIAVAQTTFTPDVPPTSVVIKNVTSGSTSNLILDVVTMFELPADTGYTIATFGGVVAGTRYGFAGFGHTDQVLDSHGVPAPYGMFATLGAGDGTPAYSFAGYGGGNLTYTFSQLVISASGTLTITGGTHALLPLPAITGSGTTTELGRLAGTLHTRYNTSAYGGGSAARSLPHGTVVGHGLGGRLGEVVGVLPRGYVTASGSVGAVGNVTGVLSGLQSTASGVLIATYGGYELRATGKVTVTVEYEAYSITLLESDRGLGTATTHYTNYPFDRIVRFGSTYYGVAADGLYELNGADFNGTPIIANVITAETDFGSPAFKRPENLYLGGRVGADMDVSVVSEELGDDTYAYRPVSKDGARTHRVQFGKGIRARFMAFQLTNVNGEDFEIDDMTPDVAETKRTI